MTPETPQKLEIDWLKTAGGAFAAVSSAFLLSTLGAAGTIIGAAIGSVIVTVGGALYSQGLARSHQRLAQVQVSARRRVGAAHAEERRHDVKDDPGALSSRPTGPSWRERLVVLPWKRISLVAAGFFAAAVLVITAFELVAGQTVSSITGDTDGGGGPTISRIGGGSDEDTSKEDNLDPSDSPSSPSDAPSTDPSGEPVPTSEPTTPSETPTPATTPTAPTPTAPTTSETVVPTDPATTPSTG